MEHRDRAGYSKLETMELEDVQEFLAHNAGRLETAELTVRRSGGTFTAELCDTEETMPSSS